MSRRIRVIRILEYEGDEKWVRESLERRAIKGSSAGFVHPNYGVIREGFVQPADNYPWWNEMVVSDEPTTTK